MLYTRDHTGTETYKGETYRLEQRVIHSTYSDKLTKVWCWEVTSGPRAGMFGGKQHYKADARRWAQHEITLGAAEAAGQDAPVTGTTVEV